MEPIRTPDEYRAAIQRHRDLAEAAREQGNDWLSSSHLSVVEDLADECRRLHGVLSI